MTDPQDFLKCPGCHRSRTVKLVMYIEGDALLECDACGEAAIADKLHEHDRIYHASQKGSYSR